MATFKPTVIKTNIRKDGTFNCVIRVTHNRKSKYVKTPIYITPKQLNKAGEIKDPFVLDSLNEIVKDYRSKVVSIADRIQYFDLDSLIEYLTRANEDIDFIKFGQELMETKTGNTKSNYRTVLNALVDFKGKTIPISSINSSFLRSLEKYLLSTRDIVRVDRWGREVRTQEPSVSARTLYNYMNTIKAIFNHARDLYNNEDVGDVRIPFYPFRKYKIPSPGSSAKRNLTVDEIRKIREAGTFASDVFMISFYLCGMNTVDIYAADTIINGRLEYKRSKTANKRDDHAFISLKIEPELQALIDKHRDSSGKRVFNFYKTYRESRNFTNYVNQGLKKILPGKTTYYARHSWATIARNECGVSKDIVSESLNHSTGRNVTDIYLARDWKGVDAANRSVIDLVGGATDAKSR